MNETKTYLIYFDESGDDGNNIESSKFFILTSTIISSIEWKNIYNNIIHFRKQLKDKYGLHIKEEFHAKNFFYDKDPYRKYHWDLKEKKEILIKYIDFISSLNIKINNIIIQKEKITKDNYNVLEKALFYSIQKINKSSINNYKYLIITDGGRTPAMRKAARKICLDNPQLKNTLYLFGSEINMIEDILEKDSKESYFIQISDMVATIVGMYFNYYITSKSLPKRLASLIDKDFIRNSIDSFKKGGILDIGNKKLDKYGFECYPK